MNEYKKQAEDFLHDTETSLTVIEAVPQKDPLWTKKGEKHGINYSVTLKNKRHTYVFDFWGSIADLEKLELAERAETRGIYSSEYFAIKDWCNEQATQTVPGIIKGNTATIGIQKEYTANRWLKNVVETVKILIKPKAYDILACLNTLEEDTLEDFCSALGYDSDSITALNTFEACKEQDRQLRKLFTMDQLEKLNNIN